MISCHLFFGGACRKSSPVVFTMKTVGNFPPVASGIILLQKALKCNYGYVGSYKKERNCLPARVRRQGGDTSMDNDSLIILMMLTAAICWWLKIHLWESKKLAEEIKQQTKDRQVRAERVKRLLNRQ